MQPSPTTSALLRSFLQGDRSAFHELYERVAPSLFLWSSLRIPRALRQRLDARDLMQETWCRALGAFRRFDPRRASFRAWIFGIASRTLAEELRRLQVRRRELAPAERPEGTQDLEEIPAALRSITQQVAHREELAELLRIAETLAPEERELLVYRGIEGLPHAEVASRLGIAPEACEARWRRLRARLRAQLPEEGLLGET